MISQPVKNILMEFGDIFQKFGENEVTSKEVKLLKLWKEEIESEKQSIFIIGKTSTGKSEFHNFLLDIDNKNDAIFKTSTKVETGIIQTLEHCENRTTAYAEIIIKNKNEFNKLSIPPNINIELKDGSCKINLDNSERIRFFRDNVIAKSDKGTNFNLIAAVAQVNIKYPLKYFKRYRIIDTPGLASSISATDSVVKEYFHGKSHIFWFLDASKQTMSDNLTLLLEERKLLAMGIDRVNFIANKFDLMEYDNDNNSKDEVLKRKQVLTDLLKKTLVDILEIKDVNPNIIFTSFKKPGKKFVESDTYQEIRSIEGSLISNKNESNYRNITSLISTMNVVVERINETEIAKKEKEIDDERVNLKSKEKENFLEKKKIDKQKSETLGIIEKSIGDIRSIEKEKNLNTHQRYNKYVEKLSAEVKKSCERIENSTRRIRDLELTDFKNKLNQISSLKDFSLKGKESLWKKYIIDRELDNNKNKLNDYVAIKIREFSSLERILNEAVRNKENKESKKIKESEDKLFYKKENVAQNKNLIFNIKLKLSNIDKYLLEDIENGVNQWVPQRDSENSTLISFLKLYSLLEQYRIIRIRKNSDE